MQNSGLLRENSELDLRLQELEGTLERKELAETAAEEVERKLEAEAAEARGREQQEVEDEEQRMRERKEDEEARRRAAHNRSASVPAKPRTAALPQEDVPEVQVGTFPASSFNRTAL